MRKIRDEITWEAVLRSELFSTKLSNLSPLWRTLSIVLCCKSIQAHNKQQLKVATICKHSRFSAAKTTRLACRLGYKQDQNKTIIKSLSECLLHVFLLVVQVGCVVYWKSSNYYRIQYYGLYLIGMNHLRQIMFVHPEKVPAHLRPNTLAQQLC